MDIKEERNDTLNFSVEQKQNYISLITLLLDSNFSPVTFKKQSMNQLALRTLSSINVFSSSKVTNYLAERLKSITIKVIDHLDEDSAYVYCYLEKEHFLYDEIILPNCCTKKTESLLAHELGHIIYKEHQKKKDSFPLYEEVIPLLFEYFSFYPRQEDFMRYRLKIEQETIARCYETVQSLELNPNYQPVELFQIISYIESFNILCQLLKQMKSTPYYSLSCIEKLCFGELSMDEFFKENKLNPNDFTELYETIEKYRKKDRLETLEEGFHKKS